MPSLSCDVLVLGGGPAGSATALLLARRGYEVVLVDRAAFPRPKPCGEYLTPGAVALLQGEFGVLPALLRQGASWLHEERVVGHFGPAFFGPTEALACPRTVMDAALLNAARAAGVTVRERFNVRRILTEDGVVTGAVGVDAEGTESAIQARFTVGADGTRSLLARTLGVVRPIRGLQRIALVGHFTSPPATREAGGGGRGNSVTMHLPYRNVLPDACCGVGAACGPDGAGATNVNMVVPAGEASRMAGRHAAYFRETLQTAFPAVAEQFADAELADPIQTVGCFGHHVTRAASPGALLVGDAATFVHPFTGEGVYFALRGAQLAAEAVDAALRDGSVVPAGYDAARRRDLLPRYRLCRAVAHIVHSPALLTWASARLRRSPGLTRAVLSAVGDVSRPSDLFTPANLRLLAASQ